MLVKSRLGISKYASSFTNSAYLESFEAFDGASNDSDGDGILFYDLVGLDMDTGSFQFSLDGVVGNTIYDGDGSQSGEVAMVIGSATPDQTVILVTVQITGTDQVILGANKLLPKAYADDQATTQVRILVSNPLQNTPLPDDLILRTGKGL